MHQNIVIGTWSGTGQGCSFVPNIVYPKRKEVVSEVLFFGNEASFF
ncbi:hypothetical protein KJ782_00765 [Patescibacteria group bacterium]|nr:hypothetical protein [Patescibacteria group bacterium]